jgi:hypothetical protein
LPHEHQAGDFKPAVIARLHGFGARKQSILCWHLAGNPGR